MRQSRRRLRGAAALLLDEKGRRGKKYAYVIWPGMMWKNAFRGHLIEISEEILGWYDLLGQPLASIKMPLLSVPSGGQCHGSR